MKKILYISLLLALVTFPIIAQTDQNGVRKIEMTVETLCDSIYPGNGYRIVQQYFPDGGVDALCQANSIFFLFANDRIIFQDTLYSSNGTVEFRDFDGDKVKDILIQNESSARSNWTYNLFLVDTTNNKITKVKGFNEIVNPNYLPDYDLIDNYVVSGRNWTSFYEMQCDTIRNFGFLIYDSCGQEEPCDYQGDYKKALAEIQELRKMEKEANE